MGDVYDVIENELKRKEKMKLRQEMEKIIVERNKILQVKNGKGESEPVGLSNISLDMLEDVSVGFRRCDFRSK